MTDTKTLLVACHGIFLEGRDPGSFSVQSESGEVTSLTPIFESLVGRQVHLELHYLPPSGVFDSTQTPRDQCCLLRQHCDAGHMVDPWHLFSMSKSGTLGNLHSNLWAIDSDIIPIHSQMVGHYGRIVLFSEGSAYEDGSVEKLQQEASALSEVLSSLRGILKEPT